jgi:N,N'-diacetyllegionaminate synthase
MISHTLIIAEAGVNHNGDIAIALRLIDEAAAAGADAVKFQSFFTDQLVVVGARKAAYQTKTGEAGETQYGLLKRLELSPGDQRRLSDHCREKKILFMSSPFDLESIDLLSELGVAILKIPSGEITNLPYLRKIGALKKKIILSTGMATLEEIRTAMEILIDRGTAKEDITILHCNTEYPTPMADVNLSAMLTIKKSLDVAVGYSDHTLGIEIPIAAVALGAAVIEKHFTLDKNMPGPDHASSLDPSGLKAMVCAIRNIEKALGDGVKKPSPSEGKNMAVARKSIVARRGISKGERFTAENITVKRPGDGLSPMMWDSVIGKKAARDFKENERIDLSNLE